MFSRTKSSNCSSGHVEISFDNAVKQFLPKGLEFFAHATKNFKNFSTFLKNFPQNVSPITSNVVLAFFWTPSAQNSINLNFSKKLMDYIISKEVFSNNLHCRRTIPFWQRFRYFPRKVPKNFGQRPKRFEYCTNFSQKSSPTVPVGPYQADLTKNKFAKVRKIFAFNQKKFRVLKNITAPFYQNASLVM